MTSIVHDITPIKTDSRLVKSVFEHTTKNRLHQIPVGTECAIKDLKRIRNEWKDKGSVVVFVSGVFDLLHVNHLLALTQYRLLGAQKYLRIMGMQRDASPDELHDIAASERVKMILSLDSDKRVEQDKAFKSEKGGCPKPLVSWNNRALILARQYMSGLNGCSVPLVDYITMHGNGSCVCDACPYRDNAYLARAINPDLVVACRVHTKTIELLQENRELNRDQIVVIDEDDLFYFDPLLNGPVKASNIVKRAQQTRPGE